MFDTYKKVPCEGKECPLCKAGVKRNRVVFIRDEVSNQDLLWEMKEETYNKIYGEKGG